MEAVSATTTSEFPFLWTTTLVIEGRRLHDGRMLVPGALEWSHLPLPLFSDLIPRRELAGAIIGRVERIWREGDEVKAAGVADRPLSGEGAGMEVSVNKSYFFYSEILPQGAGIDLTRCTLRSVAVVAEPCVPEARFEAA